MPYGVHLVLYQFLLVRGCLKGHENIDFQYPAIHAEMG
jgi:hypothetical protein